MWFLLDADPMHWSWQGFVILNLGALVALAFWLGSIVARHNRLEEDRKEDRRETQRGIEEGKRCLDEYERELTKMKSAYHHVSGYLHRQDPSWKGYDFSRERPE